MEWPAEPVDVATAARLFEQAGVKVDRSNLSRFIDSREFPCVLAGRRKLVDPKALFDFYTEDFSRQVMSGQGTAPPPETPGQTETARRSDPKREETELKVAERRLNLNERLRQLIPAVEVDAAVAEAMADMKSAAAQTRADFADALLAELGLPATKLAPLRQGLKRYANALFENFAARAATAAAAINEPASDARARFDELVAFAEELRGEINIDGAPDQAA